MEGKEDQSAKIKRAEELVGEIIIRRTQIKKIDREIITFTLELKALLLDQSTRTVRGPKPNNEFIINHIREHSPIDFSVLAHATYGEDTPKNRGKVSGRLDWLQKRGAIIKGEKKGEWKVV
jgi:hypothetical protein